MKIVIDFNNCYQLYSISSQIIIESLIYQALKQDGFNIKVFYNSIILLFYSRL